MKARTKKILIIVSVIVGVIILAAVGAGIYIQKKAGTLISNEFSKLTDGKYTLETRSTKLSLLNGRLTMRGVRIYESGRPGTGDGTGATIALDRLDLRGIDIGRGDGLTSFSASTLTLNKPVVYVHRKADPGPEEEKEPLMDRLGKAVSFLGIGRIIISDGEIHYSAPAPAGVADYIIKDLNVAAVNFALDPARPAVDKFLYSDNIRLSFSEMEYSVSAGLYTWVIGSLETDSSDGTLNISGISMNPRYGKYKFAHAAPRHEDWTRISTGPIAVTGLDYNRLLSEGALYADGLTVDGASIESYKNRKIARREWIKPMYHKMLQDMDFKFHIRSAEVRNMKAVYEELPVKGERPGRISFDNIVSKFDDLTNISGNGIHYLTLNASARMLVSGQINAVFRLPIDRGNDHFTVTADVGRMDPTVLNAIILPLAKAEIQGGTIQSMHYEMLGNSSSAQIEMQFLYDDIRVNILKETDDGELKERKFLSNLANGIFIRNSNPNEQGLVIAHGQAERDPYRSPWNYLWKGLESGVIQIATGKEISPDKLNGGADRQREHEEKGLFKIEDGKLILRDREERAEEEGNVIRTESEGPEWIKNQKPQRRRGLF